MENQTYWTERSIADSKRVWLSVDKYNNQVGKEYKKALADIQLQVDSLYARYAKNGKIDILELKRELSAIDKKKLYSKIDDLYKIYKVNPSDGIMAEIEKLSLKTRIDRLDDVMLNISSTLSASNSLIVSNTANFLLEKYSEAFNHNIFNVFSGLGEGRAFNMPNENLIKQAINFQWSGENFSDRLWNNKNLLTKSIRDTVTQGSIQGKSIDKMTKELATKLDSNLIFQLYGLGLVKYEKNRCWPS
jgi:hypothetical protein